MTLFITCVPCKCSALLWALFVFAATPSFLFVSNLANPMFIEWSLLTMNSTQLSFPLIIDTTGLIFASVVLFISANIMQFTAFYMDDDNFKERFSHTVLLFVASMNLLIFIPHLIFLLIGWDGLGITSFILVMYYQTPKALAGGMLTALTNRIGDVLILLSIAWSFNHGMWTITTPHQFTFSPLLLTAVAVAALTKSAQLPFSSWLPAAMAAPTPVSALVHSSTLVTAGVFLLIRFFPSLNTMPLFKPLILLTASLTMFMASISAMTENDMKKIIALSTLSQLGVMMASLGLNLPNLALLHLMTHALFKALLFVCAGTIILYSNHAQDLRSFGNYATQYPFLLTPMLIASLALVGTPFLPAFYSKDLILEMASSSTTNILIITLLFFSTALTSAYTIRLLLSTSWTPTMTPPFIHSPHSLHLSVTKSGPIMTTAATTGGAILSWVFLPTLPEPPLPPLLKSLALIMTFLGALTIWLLQKSSLPKTFNLRALTFLPFSSEMWFLTPISSQLSMFPPLLSSHTLLKSMDQGWNELSGGQGTLMLSLSAASSKQLWQNNMITSHLSLILFSTIPLTLLALT